MFNNRRSFYSTQAYWASALRLSSPSEGVCCCFLCVCFFLVFFFGGGGGGRCPLPRPCHVVRFEDELGLYCLYFDVD